MATGPTGGFVFRPGEGRRIDLGGFTMSVKASELETDGQFTLLEAGEPPGFGPPLHIHHDCDEAFYVLDGEYIIFMDGVEYRCLAGSFVYIPRGMPHGFRVGSVQSRKLNLYVPGAMTSYFDQLSAALQRGEADEVALAAIDEKNSVEILGPVPEGYI